MWPPTASREVWQEKFIKLLKAQIRWNPLPVLALRHFVCQSRRILPDTVSLAQTQCSCGLADNFHFRKTRNQLVVTSNRIVEDWGKYLGDHTMSTAILDRLMHRSDLLAFEGKSYRLKEAVSRITSASAA